MCVTSLHKTVIRRVNNLLTQQKREQNASASMFSFSFVFILFCITFYNFYITKENVSTYNFIVQNTLIYNENLTRNQRRYLIRKNSHRSLSISELVERSINGLDVRGIAIFLQYCLMYDIETNPGPANLDHGIKDSVSPVAILSGNIPSITITGDIKQNEAMRQYLIKNDLLLEKLNKKKITDVMYMAEKILLEEELAREVANIPNDITTVPNITYTQTISPPTVNGDTFQPNTVPPRRIQNDNNAKIPQGKEEVYFNNSNLIHDKKELLSILKDLEMKKEKNELHLLGWYLLLEDITNDNYDLKDIPYIKKSQVAGWLHNYIDVFNENDVTDKVDSTLVDTGHVFLPTNPQTGQKLVRNIQPNQIRVNRTHNGMPVQRLNRTGDLQTPPNHDVTKNMYYRLNKVYAQCTSAKDLLNCLIKSFYVNEPWMLGFCETIVHHHPVNITVGNVIINNEYDAISYIAACFLRRQTNWRLWRDVMVELSNHSNLLNAWFYSKKLCSICFHHKLCQVGGVVPRLNNYHRSNINALGPDVLKRSVLADVRAMWAARHNKEMHSLNGNIETIDNLTVNTQHAYLMGVAQRYLTQRTTAVDYDNGAYPLQHTAEILGKHHLRNGTHLKHLLTDEVYTELAQGLPTARYVVPHDANVANVDLVLHNYGLSQGYGIGHGERTNGDVSKLTTLGEYLLEQLSKSENIVGTANIMKLKETMVDPENLFGLTELVNNYASSNKVSGNLNMVLKALGYSTSLSPVATRTSGTRNMYTTYNQDVRTPFGRYFPLRTNVVDLPAIHAWATNVNGLIRFISKGEGATNDIAPTMIGNELAIVPVTRELYQSHKMLCLWTLLHLEYPFRAIGGARTMHKVDGSQILKHTAEADGTTHAGEMLPTMSTSSMIRISGAHSKVLFVMMESSDAPTTINIQRPAAVVAVNLNFPANTGRLNNFAVGVNISNGLQDYFNTSRASDWINVLQWAKGKKLISDGQLSMGQRMWAQMHMLFYPKDGILRDPDGTTDDFSFHVGIKTCTTAVGNTNAPGYADGDEVSTSASYLLNGFLQRPLPVANIRTGGTHIIIPADTHIMNVLILGGICTITSSTTCTYRSLSQGGMSLGLFGYAVHMLKSLTYMVNILGIPLACIYPTEDFTEIEKQGQKKLLGTEFGYLIDRKLIGTTYDSLGSITGLYFNDRARIDYFCNHVSVDNDLRDVIIDSAIVPISVVIDTWTNNNLKSYIKDCKWQEVKTQTGPTGERRKITKHMLLEEASIKSKLTTFGTIYNNNDSTAMYRLTDRTGVANLRSMVHNITTERDLRELRKFYGTGEVFGDDIGVFHNPITYNISTLQERVIGVEFDGSNTEVNDLRYLPVTAWGNEVTDVFDTYDFTAERIGIKIAKGDSSQTTPTTNTTTPQTGQKQTTTTPPPPISNTQQQKESGLTTDITANIDDITKEAGTEVSQ